MYLFFAQEITVRRHMAVPALADGLLDDST
jgi:hypothetical protein